MPSGSGAGTHCGCASAQCEANALGTDLAGSVDTVVDATGKYVIPGGVDVHTHMELPFGGTFASDTFETGTRAAAWGGTTTIIDFAVQKYGERVQDSLAAWHAKADGECAIDYGFHQIIGGVDDDSLKAMDELVDEGITSFKLFMAYPGVFYSDDGQVLRAMQTAANNGATIMMHAENGIAIDVLVQQALAAHGAPGAVQEPVPARHAAVQLRDPVRPVLDMALLAADVDYAVAELLIPRVLGPRRL